MRSISDILRSERKRKGFTLEDVSRATKIKIKFLEDIENGNFDLLPSQTYALGFVKNYAAYLGIDGKYAAALFRRENEARSIEVLPKFRRMRFSGRKIFTRSPRSYVILGIAVIVLSYIVFQFGSLFVGPKLSVDSPSEGQIVRANVVVIEGKTDPYATVVVNKEEAYVDLSGSFKKTLYVYEGTTKISVIAKNRSGKKTEKIVNVIVK